MGKSKESLILLNVENMVYSKVMVKDIDFVVPQGQGALVTFKDGTKMQVLDDYSYIQKHLTAVAK